MAKSKDVRSKARTDKGPTVAPLSVCYLRLEGLPLFESTLHGRQHLHLTELPNGKVKVLQRLGLLVRVVLEEQLGKPKPSERNLRAESPVAISIASSY